MAAACLELLARGPMPLDGTVESAASRSCPISAPGPPPCTRPACARTRKAAARRCSFCAGHARGAGRCGPLGARSLAAASPVEAATLACCARPGRRGRVALRNFLRNYRPGSQGDARGSPARQGVLTQPMARGPGPQLQPQLQPRPATRRPLHLSLELHRHHHHASPPPWTTCKPC